MHRDRRDRRDLLEQPAAEPGEQHGMLDHEKLEAFQRALSLVALLEPPTRDKTIRAHLRDQLDRAATSVVLNIAEGAGEFSKLEKARFYRMARRSCTETAAIAAILQQRGKIDAALFDRVIEVCRQIVSMLVALIRGAEARAKAEAEAEAG